MEWVVYSLRRGMRTPFYVGTTSNWRRRLKEHKSFFGPRIILDILEEGSGDKKERDKAECYWIEAYRSLGYKLANKTEGGDDGVQGHGSETRTKLSALFRGRIVSAETRAKLSKSLTGRELSPEWRAKISVTLKAYYSDPETPRAGVAVLPVERRRELGKKGGAAARDKYPDAHITRMRRWWDSMSSEERKAFIDRRTAATTSEARSRAQKLLHQRHPERGKELGNAVRNWWASLTSEQKATEILRRAETRRQNKSVRQNIDKNAAD